MTRAAPDHGDGVSVVVLAAGAGRRFAAESGRFKLVEPLSDGRPMVRAVCQTALQATNDVIVVGHGHQDLLHEALAGLPVRHVLCAQAELGMGASIKCGVKQVAETRAVLILLADMPYVRLATVLAVRQALADGAGLARACYQGRPGEGGPGHPVGFAAGFRHELLSIDDAQGAAALLRVHAAALRQVPVDDPGCLHDIDVPSDLIDST